MSLLNGIVSYHKMEGNSNDSVGTAHGNDDVMSYSAVNGKVGSGAAFNGSSRIRDLGTFALYSFIQNTGVFTISAWMKRTSIGALVFPMGNTQTGVEKGFFWGFNADNSIRIAIVNASGTPIIDSSAASFFTDTNWHLVSVVGDGTNITFYRDTTAFPGSGTMSSFSSGDSARYLYFGQIISLGSNFYEGDMDEVGIWSRNLSAGEISQLYNNGAGTTHPFSTGNFFQFFNE